MPPRRRTGSCGWGRKSEGPATRRSAKPENRCRCGSGGYAHRVPRCLRPSMVHAFDVRIMVVHPLSNRPPGLPTVASSGQATLRHPEASPYRCFLPDLTGFEGFRRAGPNPQRRLPPAVPKGTALEWEFDPAVAGCGYRAPLAPRLARPCRYYGKFPVYVKALMRGSHGCGYGLRHAKMRRFS